MDDHHFDILICRIEHGRNSVGIARLLCFPAFLIAIVTDVLYPVM